MKIEMQRRQVEGIEIFDLKGRLVAPHTIEFREQVRALLEENALRVILNLADVSFVDSSGLGALVGLHSDFEQGGGALKLENLSKRTMELLVLTKLSVVFETFENERDAVNSFYPDRAPRTFDILEFVREQQDEPE